MKITTGRGAAVEEVFFVKALHCVPDISLLQGASILCEFWNFLWTKVVLPDSLYKSLTLQRGSESRPLCTFYKTLILILMPLLAPCEVATPPAKKMGYFLNARHGAPPGRNQDLKNKSCTFRRSWRKIL